MKCEILQLIVYINSVLPRKKLSAAVHGKISLIKTETSFSDIHSIHFISITNAVYLKHIRHPDISALL